MMIQSKIINTINANNFDCILKKDKKIFLFGIYYYICDDKNLKYEIHN